MKDTKIDKLSNVQKHDIFKILDFSKLDEKILPDEWKTSEAAMRADLELEFDMPATNSLLDLIYDHMAVCVLFTF